MKNLKFLLDLIVTLLIYVAIILIYVLIWKVIFQIENDFIVVCLPIINVYIGWKIVNNNYLSCYSLQFETKIPRIVVAPFAIPLWIAEQIIEFIFHTIRQDKTLTVKQNINKDNSKMIHNNYHFTSQNITEIENTEEEETDEVKEYYCERCFKKITQEEWELYDCMCQECMEEVNFDNLK